MDENQYLFTKAGYQKLLDKKDELEREIWNAGQRAGEAAGLNSDWHDNPAYDYAVLDMQMASQQLNELKEILLHAKVVENDGVSEASAVQIGSRVVLLIEGEREEYLIGGKGEGQPNSGVISYNSPLGLAVMGHHAGEVVKVHAPSGTFETKIISVQ